MKLTHMSAAALSVLLYSMPAYASDFAFNLNGPTVRGSVVITYSANPNTGVLPGTAPNPVDPIGSYIVTGATGTFADTTLGWTKTITGVAGSNPSSPNATNLLAPASFGHYLVASGVPGPDGIAPGFSYDNLFYPDGSPQTATDYPFHGGFLDIYGLVFKTTDNVVINFWSNGDFGNGVSYGAGYTDGLTVLGRAESIGVAAVPEPASWAMMIVGFGVAGSALRLRRQRQIKVSSR